jgi:AMP-activated protein kinase-like protein
MQTDLQRYLDGELSRDELNVDAQRDADRFEVVVRTATAQRTRAPGWLENRIMVSLPTQPQTAVSTRVASWWLEPRRVRIRPLPMGLAGASALVVGFLISPWRDYLGAGDIETPPAAVVPISDGPQVYWQFVLSAPEASSVAVSGSFNNWQADGVALRDLDGDGVWTGTVPLPPGSHKYMFLIDGKTWVTDPHAERYYDDGYGMRNAVITVVPPPARTL